MLQSVSQVGSQQVSESKGITSYVKHGTRCTGLQSAPREDDAAPVGTVDVLQEGRLEALGHVFGHLDRGRPGLMARVRVGARCWGPGGRCWRGSVLERGRLERSGASGVVVCVVQVQVQVQVQVHTHRPVQARVM